MEKKKGTQDSLNSDKKKALETALQQIEKNFGKGTVMRLDDVGAAYRGRGAKARR